VNPFPARSSPAMLTIGQAIAGKEVRDRQTFNFRLLTFDFNFKFEFEFEIEFEAVGC
jgi:hypothetical protein